MRSVPVFLVASLVAIAPTAARSQCTSDLRTIGVPALNDLGAREYQSGHLGGLYPGGSNARPLAHRERLVDAATNDVVPRDASGTVDTARGAIGLVSIGMSNTSQEFDGGASTFLPRAGQDPAIGPRMVIVNGAQGGQAAEDWAGGDATWDVLAARIAAAGITAEQVQVAWIKHANRGPARLGAFPAHAESLRDDLRAIVLRLRRTHPHLAIVFLSSRTRAWTDASGALNPEPFAYESGFSVRWLIEEQLRGDPDLDPASGLAPLLAWGPYLWADGEVPRSDGALWLASDTVNDCTHPSTSGRAKVAGQLLAFFKSDPAATPWFLRSTPPADAPIVAVTPAVAGGPAPLTVTFDAAAEPARAERSIAGFAWTFDDGCTSLSARATKTFPNPGAYDVRVTVNDDAGNVTTIAIAVTVTEDGEPVAPSGITPSSPLPAARVGVRFVTRFAASGTLPMAWRLVSGELPPGLALSPDGSSSGTPTRSGEFAFTLEVANAGGATSALLEHVVTVPADTPPDAPLVLEPVADAYVRDGSFAAQNFGTTATLAVRASTAADQRARSLLRFDLAELAAADVACDRAELRLRVASGGEPRVTVSEVLGDDEWDERTVTWTSMPALGDEVATFQIDGAVAEYRVDVTAAALRALADDARLDLALHDSGASGPLIFFASREAGATGPRLELECSASGEPRFLRADANADGEIDISDAVKVLLFLFAGGDALGCEKAGDANDDGALDVTDPVFVLDRLFRGGSAPPAPSSRCGADPTIDDLACAVSPPCA